MAWQYSMRGQSTICYLHQIIFEEEARPDAPSIARVWHDQRREITRTLVPKPRARRPVEAPSSRRSLQANERRPTTTDSQRTTLNSKPTDLLNSQLTTPLSSSQAQLTLPIHILAKPKRNPLPIPHTTIYLRPPFVSILSRSTIPRIAAKLNLRALGILARRIAGSLGAVAVPQPVDHDGCGLDGAFFDGQREWALGLGLGGRGGRRVL
jgi:hypothetical protein